MADRCGPPGVWRWAVAPRDSSVPWVRRAVREVLARQATALDEPLRDDLLLVVTELVTNGVRHAAAHTVEITVEMALGQDRVRLSVTDGHPLPPRTHHAEPDAHQIGGRGLLLVRALAREASGRCGVTPVADGGKSVWVELPVR